MTEQEVAGLGPAFAGFLVRFRRCFGQQRTAAHFDTYGRGLLSDLARKSIEPIALACGTAVRTLQAFLRDRVGDHFGMRDRLQQRLARQPALSAADELGTIGVIEETSVAKKGSKTPGVHRQYCGSRGKSRRREHRPWPRFVIATSSTTTSAGAAGDVDEFIDSQPSLPDKPNHGEQKLAFPLQELSMRLTVRVVGNPVRCHGGGSFGYDTHIQADPGQSSACPAE